MWAVLCFPRHSYFPPPAERGREGEISIRLPQTDGSRNYGNCSGTHFDGTVLRKAGPCYVRLKRYRCCSYAESGHMPVGERWKRQPKQKHPSSSPHSCFLQDCLPNYSLSSILEAVSFQRISSVTKCYPHWIHQYHLLLTCNLSSKPNLWHRSHFLFSLF